MTNEMRFTHDPPDRPEKRLAVRFDEERDRLVVNGVAYDANLFRGWATAEIPDVVQLYRKEREDLGVIDASFEVTYKLDL